MSSMVKTLPARHLLTVIDYHRMGETGILRPDARVELIEGEIIDMAPIGSRHAGTVEQVARILHRAAGEHFMIRTQQPISLGEHSEPEPDIAVVLPRGDYYKMRHPVPTDVLLIIEVSGASLRYDHDVKMPLYAKHGIPEAWVIDLEHRQLTRYNDPRAGVYATVDAPRSDPTIAPRLLPEIRLDLSAVFAE